MGIAIMAKRSSESSKPDQPKATTRALRVSAEYEAWMEKFAAHERVSIAALIDRALASHAEKMGFDPPPDRT